MSRSFKKVPGHCDRNPFAKKVANRKVRRDWTIPSGGAYRKAYESWDICDFRFLYFDAFDLVRFESDKPWRPWMK